MSEPGYTASPDVVSREVAGEAVLLNLESGLYFGLNEVGSAIWQALDEGSHTLNSLCDLVEDRFDAPRSVIEGDVETLLRALEAHDLVTKT